MTLYGRSAVFNELVPELVGLKPEGHSLLPIPDGSPLLVRCTGGRYSGKTALLERLVERYAQRVPQAYADLGADDFGQPGLAPPDDGTANASRTTDLLFYLMDRLSQQPRQFRGKLTFPRLTQGLLAVTSWQAVQPAELAAARSRLAGLLRESQPDVQKRRDQVAGWITQVTEGLGTVPGLGPGLRELVPPLAEIVTTELLGPHANRDGLKWWSKRRVNSQGDAHAQLTELAMRFRGDRDDRRRAERHLHAALLEDMADHYTLLRRMNRVPRPLLLLDNVHTELGQEVWDTLTRVWHEETPRAWPGVVATSLAAEPAVPDPDGAPSTRNAAGPFWRQEKPEAPPGWVLRLPLARLGLDEVKEMFGADRPEPGAAQVIHRLSAGRAGIAHTLVQAVRGQIRRGEPVDVRSLLDLPYGAEPAPHVNERLLGILIPAQVARARLVYYAPALDDTAAHHLSAHYPPGDPGGVPVQETLARLRDDHWGRCPWPGIDGPFVADPTLRTLLLHDLRLRTQETPEAERWKNIHLMLRSLYAPDAYGSTTASHDVRYLHHSLAIGDTDTVARALHRRLAQQDAPSWLAALSLICAAPHPPANLTAPPAATLSCPACTTDDDLVHQAVLLLLINLWEQSHPLAPPDMEKINSVRLQLLTLAQWSAPAAQRVFFQAHEQWPPLLNRWRQAPDLPTYGEART
ncbi:hypothetical protein [Streptomyces sp. SCL15-4]|uniref:hypothetical protein n=1 Tax=Streptomyces sp. SCL15-4 TaxID=2967221 RepID=UPI0029668D0F|nr:hypothetical protein [Streptomyces sp. SCL15-4]